MGQIMQPSLYRRSFLRFPLIFGGFLSIAGIGFAYRELWMGDIEAERNKLYKENAEGTKLIEEYKVEYKKRKGQ